MSTIETGVRIRSTDLMGAYWGKPPELSTLQTQEQLAGEAAAIYSDSVQLSDSVDDPAQLLKTLRKNFLTTLPKNPHLLTIPLIGFVHDESERELDVESNPASRHLSKAIAHGSTLMVYREIIDKNSIRYPQIVPIMDKMSIEIRKFFRHKSRIDNVSINELLERRNIGVQALSAIKHHIPNEPVIADFPEVVDDETPIELTKPGLIEAPLTILFYGTELALIEAILADDVQQGYEWEAQLYRELYNLTRLTHMAMEQDLDLMDHHLKGSSAYLRDVLYALSDFYRTQISIYSPPDRRQYPGALHYRIAQGEYLESMVNPRVVHSRTIYTPSSEYAGQLFQGRRMGIDAVLAQINGNTVGSQKGANENGQGLGYDEDNQNPSHASDEGFDFLPSGNELADYMEQVKREEEERRTGTKAAPAEIPEMDQLAGVEAFSPPYQEGDDEAVSNAESLPPELRGLVLDDIDSALGNLGLGVSPHSVPPVNEELSEQPYLEPTTLAEALERVAHLPDQVIVPSTAMLHSHNGGNRETQWKPQPLPKAARLVPVRESAEQGSRTVYSRLREMVMNLLRTYTH